MKRALHWSMIVTAAALPLLTGLPPVQGHPNFKIEFDKKYMVEGSAMYKANNGKTTCNLCHIGMTKARKNDYGTAMGKLLNRNDLRNFEKIQQALEKLESEKVGTTTFGELIKEGKLPTTK